MHPCLTKVYISLKQNLTDPKLLSASVLLHFSSALSNRFQNKSHINVLTSVGCVNVLNFFITDGNRQCIFTDL